MITQRLYVINMDMNSKNSLAIGKYRKNDESVKVVSCNKEVWSITGRREEEEKVYSYDEAINLAGNGWYNISLLITLTLAMQGMALDMFGFAYVVAAARCDLQLSHTQTSFLLSVPLIGAITSAYLHGYMTDTLGRKKCLDIVLWGSFVCASLSAFSPNFYVLAVLKFFSSSLSSGVQSMAFTLLGECCTVRTKGTYMLIMTTSLVCGFAVFTTHAYLVLGLDFAYDLSLITFRPWRLLIITLATALGSSAAFASFFYESPKFLINIGRTAEALEILRKINFRNNGKSNYPVRKVVLLEANNTQRSDESFLRSLWDQTAPLFRPPLLQRTLLLFYVTAAVYSVNNGFFLWIPMLCRAFFEETVSSGDNVTDSFCSLIDSQQYRVESDDCSSAVSIETFQMSIIHGVVFLVMNLGISLLAHKKKALIVYIHLFSSFCCFSMTFITEKFSTIVFFFGVQTNCFIMGIVFCYFIELYPTRHRGMISCLGVMVARISGIAGVNLVGAYTFTHCSTSLYAWGTYIFSAVLVGLMLPPDTPKKC